MYMRTGVMMSFAIPKYAPLMLAILVALLSCPLITALTTPYMAIASGR